MNHDNYLAGDYDSNSPVNQKENDIEGFDLETLAVDDYVTVKIGSHLYAGFFVQKSIHENKIIFFDEVNEIDRWADYRQIVKVGEIDIE